MPTISESLARHFHSFADRPLPAATRSGVKRLLLDYLGVAIGGSQTESGKVARGFAVTVGGSPEASLIGDGRKLSPVHAAFANAISSHSVELDDIDVLALFHFSPPVYSAALAVAESVKASGEELILALAAGCEMMERASRAANPSLRDRGYHTTPTCGVFGAAVAAGLLLKLKPDQFVSALGLAGAQAGGLMEMYGPSMQKRFNPGPAARNGVTAAMMAQMGFTGAATIFEGDRGFLKAFADHSFPEHLHAGLGQPYELKIEFKPYSCARPIHNAIDCALQVRSEHVPNLARVKAIRIARHPAWASYHLNASPVTYHEAQMSLPYSVAVALMDGQALFAQYNNARLTDDTLQRLSGLVDVSVDPSLPRGVSCRMVLELDDGTTRQAQVDFPKGSIENPMSDAELHLKFNSLVTPAIGRARAERLTKEVAGLEQCGSVSQLMLQTAPG